MKTESKKSNYSEIYDDDFEIIIEESSDEEESENIKILTIYDDKKNKYYIGAQVCELLGYKHKTRSINNISDKNKITFKNYSGKKEPSLDARQILITTEGVYELLKKNKKISQNAIDVFTKANIDVYKIIKNDKDDDDEDDDENEEGKLTTYTYVSNGMFFEYFVGYQITSLIGYTNVTQALTNVSKQHKLEFKDYPGVKKPLIDPKTILITGDGVVELLIKTRKRLTPDVLHMLKEFGIDTTNRKCLTKEQQTLSAIANAFKTEKIEDQFKVGSYYLDMYFPEYKIVVECDENGHADRKPYKERERMDYVNKEFDIDDTHWMRYNPDEHDFDISKIIGRIYNRISLAKKEKLEQEYTEKNESIDLITRRCNMCYEEKSMYKNFAKNGSGYRMTCKDCFGLTGKEKPVKQYNLDGTFVKRYSSVKEAAEKNNLSPSQIARNCRGLTKRAGNYMWIFVEEKKKDEITVSQEESKVDESNAEESKKEIIMESGTRILIIDSDDDELDDETDSESDEEKIAAVKYESYRMVAQYNIDGELIQTHESVAEACRCLGQKNKRSLYSAIKNNFVSFGFVWRYVDNNVINPKIEPVAPFKKYMKPVEIYKDGVLYKTFNCIKEAAKNMKVNLSMCRKFLSGAKKDPANFEWKLQIIDK